MDGDDIEKNKDQKKWGQTNEIKEKDEFKY